MLYIKLYYYIIFPKTANAINIVKYQDTLFNMMSYQYTKVQSIITIYHSIATKPITSYICKVISHIICDPIYGVI